MASFKAREAALGQMVQSILPQVDRLHVYLNDYDGLPSILRHDKIAVASLGDLGDTGKFFYVEHYVDYDDDIVWFTCDDDLLYPADYVDRMLKKLKPGEVVSCHGSILRQPADTYRNSRTTYACLRRVKHDVRVHVVGTGVTAFHSSTIAPMVTDFPVKNMADIWFAKLLQERQIRATVIAHEAGWLKLLTSATDDSLWNRGELPESIEAVRSVNWKIF